MNSIQSSQQSRSGTPVVQFIIGLVMLSFFSIMPEKTLAADIAGTSRTYVQSYETLSEKKLMPLYEYLDLNVQGVGSEDVSIHLGGWLSLLQSGALGENNSKDSDLQYGYVSYRPKALNAVVNLGRVMVFEGVAAERVDGIYGRTDIKGGFGISAFGGAPVETGVSVENSTIYGARLSHQYAGLYSVGLSYLKQAKDSLTFREEEGVDLWVRPLNSVELMGKSSYNSEMSGWGEHSYYLVLGPFANLRFNTEAALIDYKYYFAGTTTNIFKATPGGILDSRESLNILGEEVVYAINENWTASVDYKSYKYDIAGKAGYYGGKATYAMPKSYNAGLALHKMDGDTNRLKYDEYRIYASKKMNKVDLAADVMNVKYKQPINEETNAFSASIAAGYELERNIMVGLDVSYAKTPDYDKDVRMFVKVVYAFDTGVGTSGRAVERPAPAASEAPAAQPAAAAQPVPPAEQAAPAPAPADVQAVPPAAAAQPVPPAEQAAPAPADVQAAPAAAAGQPAAPAVPAEIKPKEGN